MRLLFGHDRDVAHQVCLTIPHLAQRTLDPATPYGEALGPSTALGVLNGRDELVGGVVYHNYSPEFRSIELSCAAGTSKWLSREILRALLRYPFQQLACQRVTACTPRKATSVRQFLEKLGFKREGCIRMGFGDDHCIVYGLLAGEWAAHPINRPSTRREVVDGQEVRPQSPGGA